MAALKDPLRLISARDPASWDSGAGPNDQPSQKGLAGETGYMGAGDDAVEADGGRVVS